MKVRQIFKELEVSVIALDSATQLTHKHNFFQIVYILEGTGFQIINGNRYPFKKGDIFLITPSDHHSYQLDHTPLFCVIDFTENFFHKSARSREEKIDVSDFFKRLEYLFYNQHNVKGSLSNYQNKNLVETLIQQLITEKGSDMMFGKIITQNIIFLLLNIIARSIQQDILEYSGTVLPKSRSNEVISHIQHYIFEKDKITIDHIAKSLGTSKGHLSRSFKKDTGRTIKEYITLYKLDIIKSRLKTSDLTVSEIAFELGFTDESHLNKMFKNAFGITAKQFRSSDIAQ